MISNNFPVVQKKGIFSKFIIKIKSFFGKKQYDKKINKDEFFNIYEDLKNGDISVDEIELEMLEGIVKIANEEKRIKAEKLNNLKRELVDAQNRVMNIEKDM